MFLQKSSIKKDKRSSNGEQNPIPKSQIRSKASTSKPTTIEVRGIQVHFPFQPYKCQEEYMGKVLDALNSGENGLLESPTGTGKTLCLLCSTLAWQEEQSRLIGDPHQLPLNSTKELSVESSQRVTPSKVPVIIYASRTHSQLSQVVKEMRFTRYRPKHAVLGSRDQMCIHPKVKTPKATSSDINYKCAVLAKDRKCRFRNNLDGFVVQDSVENPVGEAFGIQPVLDIEELVELGQKRKVCPFYLSRGHIADADVIFVPYNYLFDKDARETTLADVNWENAILIFDEAHNLESFASESASFDLSAIDIAGCINEVTRAIGYMKAMPELGDDSVKVDNLIKLKSIFLQLERYLDNDIPLAGGSFTGEYIFEIFAKGAQINYANHIHLLKFIRQVSEMMMEMKGGNSTTTTSSGTPQLDHFVSCIKRIFGSSTEGQCLAKARAYRVHVSAKISTSGTKSSVGGFVSNQSSNNINASSRVLSYWCFAPSLAMHELAALKVRSILVTSGTLSPLASYGLELGLPFPHTLENSHIIGGDQILVRVVGTGVSGKELTSTFTRRDDTDYIMELGNTIISLSKLIPGGVLIFFPSYSVMESCIEKWGGPLSSRSKNQGNTKANFFQAKQSRKSYVSSHGSNKYCFPHRISNGGPAGTTLWQRLMAIKSIVLEPKTTSELKEVIEEFEKYVSTPKSPGCVLMGVCRGKISEGIDFADHKCRAVIITGLPFAPYLDPKVKLKREYLDGVKTALTVNPSSEGGFGTGAHNSTNHSVPIALSGAEWYSQQAHRAVNQAIGRVIRHKEDYGAILFLDSRFSEPRHQLGVSKWIRPQFKTSGDNGIGQTIKLLVSFFRNANEKATANKTIIEKSIEKSKKPLLEYEADKEKTQERHNENISENISKIAVVSKHPGGTSDEDYIPPNQIIRKVHLNDDAGSISNSAQQQSKKFDSLSSQGIHDLDSIYEAEERKRKSAQKVRQLSLTGTKDISETIQSVWSGLSSVRASQAQHISSTAKKSTIENDSKATSKQLAKSFFELAKKTLSDKDFSQVQKILVDMKTSGDNNDNKHYIASAKNLVMLLIKYDTKKETSNHESVGIKMLDQLYCLLPQVHRHNVLKTISMVRYQRSEFKSLILSLLKDNPQASGDLQALDVSVPILLRSFYKSKLDGALQMDKSQMNDFRAIISMLFRHRISTQEILRALNHLIPVNFHNVAQLIIEEFREKSTSTRAPSDPNEKANSKSIKIVPHDISISNPYQKKRRINNNAAASTVPTKVVESSNSISKRAKQMISNAKYQTEQKDDNRVNATGLDSVATHVKEPTNGVNAVTKGLDPIERILLHASKDVFVPKQSNIVRINKKIDSKLSDTNNCTLCGNDVKSLFMAENCNHFFCLDCWTNWFKRSQTCPKCRKPTNLDSMSRVIFEDTTKPGAPSLTQLCASDNESGDDELEFIESK